MKKNSILFLGFLMLASFESLAQSIYSLQLYDESNNETVDLILNEGYEKDFTNEVERHKEMRLVLNRLLKKGYLAASIDSVVKDSFHLSGVVHLGMQFNWTRLSSGNVHQEIINELRFKEKLFLGQPFDSKEIIDLQFGILNYCENNGYPFAQIKLDSISFEEMELDEKSKHGISANLFLVKNKLYIIDSILIKGDVKVSEKYLYQYLSLSPGDIYNESKIGEVKTRIKELPFLKEIKPAQVVFTEKSAKLILNLAEKKASNFDGVAGFLPNSETTGGLLITGDARLRLLSSFGKGELLAVHWRSLQPKTQDLKMETAYPFIFSSPFGLEGQLFLYKKDTTYVDLLTKIGTRYLLRGGDYLSVFIKSKETRLLNGYTSAMPFANVRSFVYGLGYKREKLNYLLSPSKGYRILASFGAGNKKVQSDPDLNTDTITTMSSEYNLDLFAQVYIPTGTRMVLMLGFQGAYINSQSMFANELYRVGGMKTLRGFDEESIFASSYAIGTLEYRYLLERNTYMYAFFSSCYYENQVARLRGDSWVDTPIGYGAGFSFETKAGIFSINYAIGQQQGNAPDFRSAKVHFGIVNSF